ncbi:hypothetical protein FisN_3Hu290 [Fistulifera solaris]|uniref:PDZ domain-containing protein n=1 Tax=Fistulifera solaris TaxID=1519565 RepID=A0A1Z5JR33_FISSO|nr:hypothetical protein FisN_3Hu290 [Fistulifera solaris]|eukprot:GAX16228.1 hypothetical protein FisN_3Hu290 [Fistulifera solaris]
MRLDCVTETVCKVGPAVVRIDTVTNSSRESEASRRATINMITNPSKENEESNSGSGDDIGSGFIFSKEGLILTNAHVVEDAAEINVILIDGREYKAVVKGIDSVVDIAVLEIVPTDESDGFPVADLIDSDVLNVGQIVVAIGTPRGLDNTVTLGIVSGVARRLMVANKGSYRKVDYIQTSVALNPGNSGGPLVDVETGDVIGINTGAADNMEATTFSIPINRVRHIINKLGRGRNVKHGYLGISAAPCTPDVARELNAVSTLDYFIPEIHGIVIYFVHPSTPAETAGLRPGDVIVKVAGKDVESYDAVRHLIDRAAVGKVRLRLDTGSGS